MIFSLIFLSLARTNAQFSIGQNASQISYGVSSPEKVKASYSKFKTFFDYSFRSNHYSNFVANHNTTNPFVLNCGATGLATSYHLFLKTVLNNLCTAEGFSANSCTGCTNQILFTSELYSSTPSSNFTNFLVILRNNLLEYRNQALQLSSGGFSPVGTTGLSFPNGLQHGATVALMTEAVVPMEYFPGSEQDSLIEEIKTLLSQIRSTQVPGFKNYSPVKARMFLYFLMGKSTQGTIISTKVNEIISAATQGKILFSNHVTQEYADTANESLMELEINSFTIQSTAHMKSHWIIN